MKAIILAAGKGKRLGCLTKSTPKPLIPVAGKPILERIIDGLHGAGIDHCIVVTGYKKTKMEKFLQDKYYDCHQFSTIYQEVQDGTGSAVSLGKNLLSNKPFLMTYGDILVESHFYKKMIEKYQSDSQLNYMAINKVKDPSIGCAVYLHNNRVKQLVEKPEPGTSKTRYNNSGIYILQPEIFSVLAGISYSKRGELEFTAALEKMVRKKKVKYVEIKGFWSDIGTVKRLREASSFFKTCPGDTI